MTKKEIDKLIAHGEFPEISNHRKLVETHISWVILCDEFVYKIKKPIHYSFLDFSTIEKRKHFCERELQLNKRFAKDIYLEVLPIYRSEGRYQIGGDRGTALDYALKMHKLDPQKQMDVLISKNKVKKIDIKNLVECIVNFHKSTEIIYMKHVLNVKEKFKDLGLEKKFLSRHLDPKYINLIDRGIRTSDGFLSKNEKLLLSRLNSGFYRDCHGDLHTRNIFLLPAPQPFDCIEFNDDYRHIDVLNEVAFLCMDFDALGRRDLSTEFINQYNRLFQVMPTEKEHNLFTYYKCYRANVRAKVNSLRAKSAISDTDRNKVLSETKKYLGLMEGYIQLLDEF